MPANAPELRPSKVPPLAAPVLAVMVCVAGCLPAGPVAPADSRPAPNPPAPKADAGTPTRATARPPATTGLPATPATPNTPTGPTPRPPDTHVRSGAPVPTAAVVPGTPVVRHGDEIVIAGRMFRTGTAVVLWTDPGGYDAYRVERRFAPADQAGWDATVAARQKTGRGPETPNRYGARRVDLRPDTAARVARTGWDFDAVAEAVDQFVVHYDAAGTSRTCFRVLHDLRGLSVHFLIDLDGTVYQSLDVKERAWHATVANDRSVGVEMAHWGSFAAGAGAGADDLPEAMRKLYLVEGAAGVRVLTSAAGADPKADAGFRVRDYVPRPARPVPIAGLIHGRRRVQYDYTDAQYEALGRVVATLCAVLPRLRPDIPRGPDGGVLRRALTPAEFAAHAGVLGHWHVQTNKTDPGPAFDWDRLIGDVRRHLAAGGRTLPSSGPLPGSVAHPLTAEAAGR